MEPPGGADDDGAQHVGSSADKVLPIANVARIMKRALPHNAKVANDAKECMQECVTEFILFITSEASERCAVEKRKTITGEDILWAMGALSFDYYIEPLRLYLQRWRDAERAQSAKRGQGSKEGGGGGGGEQQGIELAYDAAKGGGAPSGSARITDQASSDEANAGHSD